MARPHKNGHVIDGLRAALAAAREPMSTLELTYAIGRHVHRRSVSSYLSAMVLAGTVVRSRNAPFRYALAGTPAGDTLAPPRPVVEAPRVRRNATYGECPCGCTPRVAGYFTHPTEPWKSGPVLECGRSQEAA